MKKWQIENSETSEISEILFRVFLFPSVWFCPTAKIENLDLKISKKISEFSEFSTWAKNCAAASEHIVCVCVCVCVWLLLRIFQRTFLNVRLLLKRKFVQLLLKNVLFLSKCVAAPENISCFSRNVWLLLKSIKKKCETAFERKCVNAS